MNDDLVWLTEPWMWWIALYGLLVYEFTSITWTIAHRYFGASPPPKQFQLTLSRMYWRAHKRFPLLDYIMLSVLAWLVPHLIVGDFNGAAEWGWTVIFWLGIWIVYFKRRKK